MFASSISHSVHTTQHHAVPSTPHSPPHLTFHHPQSKRTTLHNTTPNVHPYLRNQIPGIRTTRHACTPQRDCPPIVLIGGQSSFCVSRTV
ncbi:hypothetical protein GA0061077_1182 [Bifidobacterium commune]|uniref:Uncharacterized protein n=1 Tax=Bifidobacterium commune TaxID=1505727 RepID=A0A1C4H6I9_9BIFI|nr:hypothetical protein GA0061077_1182 [Bifidobacterium commune]